MGEGAGRGGRGEGEGGEVSPALKLEKSALIWGKNDLIKVI